MGKWTGEGFVANTLDYYKTEIQKVFVEAFGEDFLLDDSLPQGILITRLAELFYNADMDGVEALSRLNINTATGIFLDIIGGLRGVARSTGSPQIATVQLTCNPNNFQAFYIAQGTEFRTTGSGEIFIAETGQAVNNENDSITLKYSQNGNSTASVNDTMTTTGYDQITNIVITYLIDGAATESDLDYRARITKTLPLAGDTIENVSSLLLANDYVRLVGVNYNDTDQTVDTIPPYATEWMAVPQSGHGNDQGFLNTFKQEVGTIIINNKTPGAPTAGNTTVTVSDIFGTQKQVNFTIPTEVQLEIEVQVAVPETTGQLDLSNIEAERQDIVDYINHLDIGKDVSYARCISPLAADPGFDITYFRIRRISLISVAQTTGSDLTDIAVDKTKFETQITTTGTYAFAYNGTSWTYNSDEVDLADYGITFTGTPVNGDVLTVTYTQPGDWATGSNLTIGIREHASILASAIKIEV